MVIPYLTFHGNCAEALAFYQTVFGGQAKPPMLYGDYLPEGLNPVPEGFSAWIMHAELDLCGATVWLADEAPAPALGDNIKLTATLPTAQAAQAVFSALAQGGRVSLPPTDTFYSSFHAAVIDKFGIHWNLVAEAPPTAP